MKMIVGLQLRHCIVTMQHIFNKFDQKTKLQLFLQKECLRTQ